MSVDSSPLTEIGSDIEDSPETSGETVVLPDRKKPVPASTINVRDRSGRTLLFKYALKGDVDTCESLLKAGAEIEPIDYAGWTPLHEACLQGHDKVVSLLLSYGATVDITGGDGDTPLHDAISNGHLDVVRLLLKYGACLDTINERGSNPIEAAELYKDDSDNGPAILELLMEWKDMTTFVTKRDETGQTALHKAAHDGDTILAERLLSFGADITACDNSGWTALHEACLRGHTEMVALLLDYAAPVNAVSFDKETPLFDACANNHVHIVKLLLEYGAHISPNSQNIPPTEITTNPNILDLLTKNPTYWRPFKNPSFIPKLVVSPVKVLHHKEDEEDDDKMEFASAREEKKFKALLQSLSKGEKRPRPEFTEKKKTENKRQSLSKDPIESPKKRQVTPPPKKREPSPKRQPTPPLKEKPPLSPPPRKASPPPPKRVAKPLMVLPPQQPLEKKDIPKKKKKSFLGGLSGYQKGEDIEMTDPQPEEKKGVTIYLYGEYVTDLQIALLLGLKSGRAFLEQHPLLKTRVASAQEKEFLQTCPLSVTIYEQMKAQNENSVRWLKTVETEKGLGLRLSDLDIQLLEWDKVQDFVSHIQTDTVLLNEKPLSTTPVNINATPPRYVHKLKRFSN